MSIPLIDRFDEFFSAVHGGFDPFPWQRRIAKRVAVGRWPLALALPTASGKTACIDIAIFALACQADWPDHRPRTAPRRVIMTVDRRVIVDEAFEHSLNLARKLNEAETGILREVADRLRSLMPVDDENEPLACVQLRGGIYRDDAWARTPTQPTIIASTVDQIGSRLLYRGYGLRAGYAWPVHAGLAANDSLIILDEAHCANPFRQTLSAIGRFRDRAETPLPNPFGVVLVSATPPADINPEDIERLGEEDLLHRVLRPRIVAKKPTVLVEAKAARGSEAMERFAKEIVKQALAVAKDGAMAIGIIVNRVAAARLIHDLLAGQQDREAILLTGRMRPIDRDELLRQWKDKLAAKVDRPQLDHPLFVVATQCLEVGANLDFDALVSECASLDSLRQRFGRLNRLGLKSNSPGVIVIRADQVNPKDEDPIYGAALPETWKWLQGHVRDGCVDLGIASMEQFIKTDLHNDPDLLKRLNAPAPDAPVMLPAYLDCWVQTSPVPCPDPDVSIFLHGPDRGAPEVQVLWRADLDLQETDSSVWIRTVDLCRPATAECMPVPLHVFRNWFSGSDETAAALSDVVGGRETEFEQSQSAQNRRVLRWLGPDASEVVEDAGAFRPGDTIVLPEAAGGWNALGHIPATRNGQPAVDRGEEANALARSKSILRLHPVLMAQWPSSTLKNELLQIAEAEDLPEDITCLRQLLTEFQQSDRCPPPLCRIVAALAQDRGLQACRHPSQQGIVLRGRRHLPSEGHDGDTYSHEDDLASATVRVSLAEHAVGVAEFAERFARSCHLEPSLVGDLILAAKFHDSGKADPRFQAWLQGGVALLAASGQLLAKSDHLQTPAGREVARRKACYPQGSRHELLSVRLIESNASLLGEAADPDLLLHLVGCHHGRCRPFAPFVDDPSPVSVAFRLNGRDLVANSGTGLERIDSGVAERFWRLVRRYGWWGLAWLEAILILADHRRSQWEETSYERSEA